MSKKTFSAAKRILTSGGLLESERNAALMTYGDSHNHTIVKPHVIGVCSKAKILYAVVGAITVKMMNRFIFCVDWSAKIFRHYVVMFKNVTVSICIRVRVIHNVPVSVKPYSSAFPIGMLFHFSVISMFSGASSFSHDGFNTRMIAIEVQ